MLGPGLAGPTCWLLVVREGLILRLSLASRLEASSEVSVPLGPWLFE